MMEQTYQTILDSLPPRRPRSKLEPYGALIRALRARGRSYREIVTILRERCGLRVATHTVYHFVQARAQKPVAPRPRRRQPSERVRRAPDPHAATSRPSSDGSDDLWTRIATLKQRAPVSPPRTPKTFAYDENTPLQLMPDVTTPKR
jgi:hypothetical protein